MAVMFAAQVWHYWIGVVLSVGVILTAIATIGGYLKRVQSPRYPKD